MFVQITDRTSVCLRLDCSKMADLCGRSVQNKRPGARYFFPRMVGEGTAFDWLSPDWLFDLGLGVSFRVRVGLG